ncbi:MAG TPA: helix-turn-helix domain-containing protein [Anaerolineales bacterium]|nr:helix-turn-helix domain-containing protein [Anaerolineales bacterium]
MSDATTKLQGLGFSQYEAQAYVALLQANPLNGYELAKASGVPRANIYNVLAKLEERGAVVRLDTEGSVRYSPVAPEELIHRVQQSLKSSLEDTKACLNNVAVQSEYENVWNAHGYPVLLEHARSMIDAAQKRLVVAFWPQEANQISDRLDSAEQRGVDLTILCMAGCPHVCAACRGKVYRYHVLPPQSSRWLVMIPDESEVLTGEIKPDGQTLAVRTRQKLMVDLSTWYIRHSIAIAAMMADLGYQWENILSPQTRAILDSIGPAGSAQGWLENMRQLVEEHGNEQTP